MSTNYCCTFEYDLSPDSDGGLKLGSFHYNTPNVRSLDGPRTFQVALGTVASIYRFDAILKKCFAYDKRIWRSDREVSDFLKACAREALGMRAH